MDAIERHKALADEIKSFQAQVAKGPLTAKDQTRFDKIYADWKVAEARNNAEQKIREVVAAAEAEDETRKRIIGEAAPHRREKTELAHPSNQQRSLAMQSWFVAQSPQGGPDKLSDEQRHACQMIGLNPMAKEIELRLRPGRPPRRWQDVDKHYEQRDIALAAQTLPTDMATAFEKGLLFWNGPRSVSDVRRTDNGRTFLFPAISDIDKVGAIIGEASTLAIATSVDPTFTTPSLGAYKYSSKSMLVSFEMIQDHPLDLASMLGELAGERIGKAQAAHFTTGTGTGQPRGFITGVVASDAGVLATAASETYDAEEPIRLQYHLDRAYRQRAVYMANDLIIRDTRLFRDDSGGAGTGKWMWEPSSQAGEPSMLAGYPIIANNDMDGVITGAAENYILAFGDFMSYKVRDVIGLRMRRLEELRADVDQIAFIGLFRTDADYVNPGEGTAAAEADPIVVLNAT